MTTTAISEIEVQFAELSPEEQLNLLERLVQKVGLGKTGKAGLLISPLVAETVDLPMPSALDRSAAEFGSASRDLLSEAW